MRRIILAVVILALTLSACGAEAADTVVIGHTGEDDAVSLEEIASLTLPGGARYNDVWGYADPDTDTYLVFFANRDTLAIVDVADPANPEVLSTIALPYSESSHHDMQTYGSTLYVVTEHNGAFSDETPAGLQIVDFSDPKNPVVTFDDSVFHSAHTIYVDTETATLYAAGTGQGMVIVDIADPLAPERLGALSAPYVHEVYVRSGIAYTSEIRDGMLGMYDVRNPAALRSIATIETPWSATHSTWLTQDGRFILTADEAHEFDDEAQRFIRAESGVAIYTNPAETGEELRRVSGILLPGASVHQIHTRGQYLIASWYTEGVVLADLSDPANPVLVATKDTSALDADYEGFGGAWGVWPDDPRGTYLYVSDMERGLVILRINGLTLP